MVNICLLKQCCAMSRKVVYDIVVIMLRKFFVRNSLQQICVETVNMSMENVNREYLPLKLFFSTMATWCAAVAAQRNNTPKCLSFLHYYLWYLIILQSIRDLYIHALKRLAFCLKVITPLCMKFLLLWRKERLVA